MSAKSVADHAPTEALPLYAQGFPVLSLALMQSLFDHLVREQERFRDDESGYLAGGFKLDICNPVALAPAQASLFILALEG